MTRTTHLNLKLKTTVECFHFIIYHTKYLSTHLCICCEIETAVLIGYHHTHINLIDNSQVGCVTSIVECLMSQYA